MSSRRAKRWTTILAGAVAAAVVAALGASMTDLGPWYQNLRKPAWQPPDVLFGPAWTLIFALIAASGIVAWTRTTDRATREWIIGLFALNGFLNILWSALFFRVQRPDWALIEVALFWLSILALMVWPTRHAPLARWLLLPYLLWVSFAAVLNLAIVRLNAPF